jgi:hypothetical protein
MKKVLLFFVLLFFPFNFICTAPITTEFPLPTICGRCFNSLQQGQICPCDELFLFEQVEHIQTENRKDVFINAIEKQNLPLVIAILNSLAEIPYSRTKFIMTAKKALSDPETSLMKAVKTKNHTLVFLLINTIEDYQQQIQFITCINNLGQSALSLALFANNQRIIDLLIQSVNEGKTKKQFIQHALHVYNTTIKFHALSPE